MQKGELTMKKLVILSIGLVALAGCGSSSQDGDQTAASGPDMAAQTQAPTAQKAEESVPAPAEASAAVAPAAFAQCRACHSVEQGGPNGVGPNLWGVFGKPAAQHAGFAYSPAMKSAGLTWDQSTLDTYLKAPMKTVPGTRMAFAGINDDAKRADVIDYLKTLAD